MQSYIPSNPASFKELFFQKPRFVEGFNTGRKNKDNDQCRLLCAAPNYSDSSDHV